MTGLPPDAVPYTGELISIKSFHSLCDGLRTPDAERRNQDSRRRRWHVTDMRERYFEFHRPTGDTMLAQRPFTEALNLAEHRRGGLFVILEHDGLAAAKNGWILHAEAPESCMLKIHSQGPIVPSSSSRMRHGVAAPLRPA